VLFLVALKNASFGYYPPREDLESSVKIAIVEPRASGREHIRMLTRARPKY
jgi:hypothetical protein